MTQLSCDPWDSDLAIEQEDINGERLVVVLSQLKETDPLP